MSPARQDINSYYPYLATYQSALQAGSYPSPDGSGWISPLYPTPYDENIKWEETTTWNVGVDAAFLNNRITASVDWYLRNTKDLLAYLPVPAGMTTSNYMNRNIGSMRNVGLEATITAKPIVTKDFTWSTSYNIAWNKNKITKLSNADVSVESLPADGPCPRALAARSPIT